MVAENWITIEFDGIDFTYTDACRLAKTVGKVRPGTIIYLCLDSAANTSTSALARLVLLRINLRAKGMDIAISGLNGRAKAVYEINRMKNLLPLRRPDTNDLGSSTVGQQNISATGRFSAGPKGHVMTRLNDVFVPYISVKI